MKTAEGVEEHEHGVGLRSKVMPVLDFTLEKYRELCEVILRNYEPLTVASYLMERPEGSVVILRHDVDRRPESALRMAELENDLGIASTYYFRMKRGVFKPEIIRKIAGMGHEVGYHYEVLDKAKGDFERAIKIFEEELERFRELCEVRTVCMHGNPLTPWVNKDLWERYDFREFGIIGEPYVSIDYNKVLYLSDTGRTWSAKFSLKDAKARGVNVESTDDVIKLLKSREADHVCILTHPNRWSDNFGDWLIELLGQSIKNVGKYLIGKRRKFDYEKKG